VRSRFGALVVGADVVHLSAAPPAVARRRGPRSDPPRRSSRARSSRRRRGARARSQSAGDEQRQDLLRELIGPEVVRAARDDRVDAVSPHVGQDEQVGGRLAGRIRARGAEWRLLGEPALRAEAAVHLVGRDVEEALHPEAPRPPRAGSACRGRWCAGTPRSPRCCGRRGSPLRSERSRRRPARGAGTTPSRSVTSPWTKWCRASDRTGSRLARSPA